MGRRCPCWANVGQRLTRENPGIDGGQWRTLVITAGLPERPPEAWVCLCGRGVVQGGRTWCKSDTVAVLRPDRRSEIIETLHWMPGCLSLAGTVTSTNRVVSGGSGWTLR